MLLEILRKRADLSSSADYSGYHRYASRRLKKLRRRENLTVRATKSYESKPLSDSESQRELLVLLAERCWAAAMTARAALEADAASGSSSLRHIIGSKFAKAIKYADQLAAIGGEQLDLHTYVALFSGEAALEKQHWEKVALHFSKVRLGISALTSSSQSSDDVLADYLTTVVDPALRLALAQLKDSHAGDLNAKAVQIVHEKAPHFLQLVKATDPKVTAEDPAVKQVRDIQFRSYTATVRYDSLAKIVLAVEEKEKELNNVDDPSSFDDVLSLWSHLAASTHEISSEITQAGQPREQDLDIIATYAQFHLLCRRIQRDAIVAAHEYGKANAVRLYDVLLQSSESMADLPGVNNDDELLSGIEMMKRYFQVKRTLALASLRPKGSLESLALVNLANKTVQRDSPQAEISLGLPISSKDYNNLKKDAQAHLIKTYALTVIQQEVENRSAVMGSVASNRNFVQAARPGNKVVIADFAVKKIDVVAVKPVFYDIAYNYVTSADSGADDVVSETNASAPKKGLFGLFK